MISAIGSQTFIYEFLRQINQICPVEHCSIIQYENEQLRGRASASLDDSKTSDRQLKLYVEGGFWRRDPAVISASHRDSNFGLLKIDIDQIEGNAEKMAGKAVLNSAILISAR